MIGFVDPDDLEPAEHPSIEFSVTDPEVLAYLLGPDGNPIATLLDRPLVTFGFGR